MTDYQSNDIASAAFLAREDSGEGRDRPSQSEWDDRGPVRGAVEVGSDDYWRMIARCRNPFADPDSDPLFDIVLMAAAGAEDEARDTYGDRVVDAAITRVLSEEGL